MRHHNYLSQSRTYGIAIRVKIGVVDAVFSDVFAVVLLVESYVLVWAVWVAEIQMSYLAVYT